MLSSDDLSRRSAVLVRRPDLGGLSVTGSDCASWLQGLVTCDVAHLGASEGRWGLVLTKPGKILSDVLVVPDTGRMLVAVPLVRFEKIQEWLRHHLIMEDADLEDVRAEVVWATLHGPEATSIAASLARELGGQWASVEMTGLGDAVLCLPPGRASELDVARGDVHAIDAEDWQRLRVERAVPLYGVDMGEEQSPHDVSLERRVVSWDKGCYLGQEAVYMQDVRGKVKRRLVLVVLESDTPPSPGTPVTDAASAVVGETRSAVRSRVLGAAAALASVRADVSAAGTRVSVGGVPGTVISPDR